MAELDPTLKQLLEAWEGGADCGHAIHDRLLELSCPNAAEWHFVTDGECDPVACSLLYGLLNGLYTLENIEKCAGMLLLFNKLRGGD